MRSKERFLLFILVPLLLGGCGGYRLEPLAINHPAHPEAMAVAKPPASKTLIYARSEVPSPQPMTALAAQEGGQGSQGGQPTVVGEGRIVATVPNAGQIVVEHGEIKGFMEAMTMGYRVEPPSLIAGLKSGDKVRFTIDVPKKAIVKIERGQELAAATSPQQTQGSPATETGQKNTVVGEGKVVATVPNAGQIVVEHGEIKGFMEAMTMGYRVEPLSLLEGLKFGDKVRFTIDVGKKAIIKIEKMP